jgi:hypothetical protein
LRATRSIAAKVLWLALGALGCSGPDASGTPAAQAGSASAQGGNATAGGSGGATAGSSAGGAAPTGAAPTWYADIAPIVGSRCQGCHRSGSIAPFGLETYEQTKMWSASLFSVLEQGFMPPFLAATTPECEPRFGFKDDLRVSPDERLLFKQWHAAGSPEGDPSSAAPIPPAPELELVDAEVNVTIPAPVTIDGSSDRFVCFSLAPDLTPLAPTGAAAAILGDQVLIDAVQVKPGNAAIVHHVLVFTDPTGESVALAGDQGSYDCFGGPKLSSPSLVMAWAPGSTPMRAPDGVAMSVPTTGRLVMQVHYHPTGAPETDSATSIQLRGYGSGIPDYIGSMVLLGNERRTRGDGMGLQKATGEAQAEFRIPAGAQGHTEAMRVPIPSGGVTNRVWAVGTHMHYAGTDMRIGIQRAAPVGEPASECLLQTPRWDFNWQRGYLYDVPIDQAPTASAGDIVELRCTYDNSMDNQFVRSALQGQGLTAPHDILLGEETLDEMCLGIFGIAQKVSDLLQ